MDYGPLKECLTYQVVVVPTSPTGLPGSPFTVTAGPVDASKINFLNLNKQY